MINVFRPSMGKEEVAAVAEVIESGWLGLGPKTAQFEEKFAAFVGADHAIATNSATAALHLACLALGVAEGDEVLVPTMTFVSTAHAVAYCGGTPVFVDVERDTLNIDPENLRSKITGRTKGIIVVHYAGHACEMEAVWEIARERGLFVIEDAAHACGSKYKGERVGGLQSDATCFSFHPVKNLATGDGGMMTTDRLEIAQLVRRLRWCGIDKSTWDRTEVADAGLRSEYAQYTWYYEVAELGYKYHMSDVMAALGLVQLQKLDAMNARRREIAVMYEAALGGLSWIDLPVEHDYTESSWHAFVIKTSMRNELNVFLRERGIATGVHYMPVHLQPYYRQRIETHCPVAEDVWRELLTLPLYPDLTDQDVKQVCAQVHNFGRSF